MKAVQHVSGLWQQTWRNLEEQLHFSLPFSAPPLVLECGVRFLLSAALSAAHVFDTYAPFALGFVAASGSGPGGFAALVGASLGYLTTLGMVSGLRYVSAGVFLYAVSYAFYDLPIYQKGWFMPLWAGIIGGLSGVLYLTEHGIHRRQLIAFATEVLLIVLSAWLYRKALQPWMKEQQGDKTLVHAGLLFLGGTLAAALGQITLFGAMGVGVVLAGTVVLVLVRRSGNESLSAGVILGLVLDLASGGAGLYTGALTFGALVAKHFREEGRWQTGLAFLLGGSITALWNGPEELQVGLVLDFGAAALLYLALPARLLDWKAQPPARAKILPAQDHPSYTKRQLEDKLNRQAQAFHTLYEDMRRGLSRPAVTEQRLEQVFDRAAEQVCQDCPRYPLCWKQDYHETYKAFHQMLTATKQRGYGKLSDAPVSFLSVCGRAGELISAANAEYSTLLHRRQMEARLRSSRWAVWRQYAQLSQLLFQTVRELEHDLAPDPEQAQPVMRFLRRHGLEAEIRVGRDPRGRLVIQLTGADLSLMSEGKLLGALSRNMGMSFALSPLERDRSGQRLTLVQEDNFQVTAGVAALSKEGETVSGDGASWFRDRDGRLWVVLCDGMGSGPGAARQSGLALSLLEDFLKAGVDPEIALSTLSTALALRGERELGFTTIDLLGMDLFSGECKSYKLGAAPTYLRQSGRVKKLSGGSLPAGLELGQETIPDVRSFQIQQGDLVIMVSDGILEGDQDQWIWPLVREYRQQSPRELAAGILEHSAGAGDDRTVLVLQLKNREAASMAKPKRECVRAG